MLLSPFSAACNYAASPLYCSYTASPLAAWRTLVSICLAKRSLNRRTTAEQPFELINRHTCTLGILEGIGVCIGVLYLQSGPNSEHNGRGYFQYAVRSTQYAVRSTQAATRSWAASEGQTTGVVVRDMPDNRAPPRFLQKTDAATFLHIYAVSYL